MMRDFVFYLCELAYLRTMRQRIEKQCHHLAEVVDHSRWIETAWNHANQLLVHLENMAAGKAEEDFVRLQSIIDADLLEDGPVLEKAREARRHTETFESLGQYFSILIGELDTTKKQQPYT